MKKNCLSIIAVMSVAILCVESCKKESFPPTTSAPAGKISQSAIVADSMILTPEGWMPASHVHLIENGYQLELKKGHVLKIKTATGELMEDFGKIQTPNLNQKNVQQNSIVNGFAGLNAISPSGNGWVTYSQWGNTNGQPINYFSTNWSVPQAPPSNNGQIIYIWNGLEPYEVDSNPNNLVIQPVLQWGANGPTGHVNTFGGQYWTISNWCAWSGGAAYTTPQTHISPGTNLQGVLTYTSQKSDGSYNYTSAFAGYSNVMNVTEGNLYNQYYYSGNIAIPFIPIENWSYEVLEVYNLPNATDYPNQLSVNMDQIKVQTGPPGVYTPAALNWTPEITPGIATLGEHTVVVSNDPNGTSGEVQLFFHPVGPYTFGVVTNHSTATYFDIVVNGNNISGPRGTAPQGQVNNVTNTSVAIESNSTVVMQVTSGYMPVSAVINGPFSPVYGVINGNNITFSNVNLSIGNSCSLTLN